MSASRSAGKIPLATVRGIEVHADIAEALARMLAAPGPYLIQIMLPAQNQVFPLMEPGTTPQDLVWRETHPGSGRRVHVRDRFDYAAGRLKEV